MVKEAEQYADDDQKRKESIEIRNQADSAIYTAEKLIAENGDKITEDLKQNVHTAIDETRTALQNEEDNWGIVIDPGGIVHRVKTGNYVGLNIGKITSIVEEQIEIREIIKDSNGRYEERMVLLPLIE